MRFTGRVVFFVLAGAAALTFGLTRSETVDLDCGGKDLRPGETCAEWGNGDGESYTYQEWVSEQEEREPNKTLMWVVIGGVLIALAPISYILGARSAHRTADIGARKALAEGRGWQYLPEGPPGTDTTYGNPNMLAGTVDGTAFQAWDVTRLNGSNVERKTFVAVSLPAAAKSFTAFGSRVIEPRELAKSVDTPEIKEIVKQAGIRDWKVTGPHLVITAERIHDRQTDEKLLPLIESAVRLARSLPAPLFATA